MGLRRLNSMPCTKIEPHEARSMLASDIATAGVADRIFVQHVIDRMVRFTPRALQAAGDVATVRRQVRRAVADTTQSMANSLIDVTIRLVHVQQVEYEEKVYGD